MTLKLSSVHHLSNKM